MLRSKRLLAKAAAAIVVASATVAFLLVLRRDGSGTIRNLGLSGLSGSTAGCPNGGWWSSYRVTLDNPSPEAAMREVLSRYGTSMVDKHDPEVSLDTIKDALAIQFLSEVDGEPVVIEDSDSTLFIGTIGAAYNLDSLLDKGITHILSTARSTRTLYKKQIKYMKTNVGGRKSHVSGTEMLELFASTSKFIHEARSSGGRVLVHDWNGQGRSSSFIIAYLMKYEGHSYQTALDLIQRTRPSAQPNKEYAKNLVRWGEELGLGFKDGDEKGSERYFQPLPPSGEKVPELGESEKYILSKNHDREKTTKRHHL